MYKRQTVIIALFIMFTYRITYSGVAYSRKYNISLGMITIITTLIMSVISNNVALSLGMVGALSIIRFRTAVKDVRDAAYIFWRIAVGICCGVSQYILAAISSVIILLFLVLFRQIGPDNRMLLIVRGELSVQNKAEAAVMQHFGKAVRRRMKNATPDHCERVYEVGQNAIKKSDERAKIDIVQKLMKIEGIQNEMCIRDRIYACQDAYLDGCFTLRAIYGEKDVVLGEGTQVLRWADAEGTLSVYDHSTLGISASSANMLVIGRDCVFRRLYAPVINLGWSLEDREGRQESADAMTALAISSEVLRNIRYVDEDNTDDDGVLSATVVSKHDVSVLEGFTVKGHIRSHKAIMIYDNAVLYLSLIHI